MADLIDTAPFAAKRFLEVKGQRMAYIDEGEGDAIVFQHGNPTSSYLWRNVMPHLRGLGRLVACDLLGMGDSAKLEQSGPDRYSYAEQRDHLHGLWAALDLGERVILVLHDWGSALGFDWANRHRDRVQGIAYMESIVTPLTWADYPEGARKQAFQGLRSPAGEDMILKHNMFVEQILPKGVIRPLTEPETAEYRRPFTKVGEDRRPTLSLARDLPIAGEPADVAATVERYGAWLAASEVPKLFVNGEPGALLTARPREVCRAWPNQVEVTVPGRHFLQEDSPHAIGEAAADFASRLRGG
jgi:haloalkane dehalogenase